MVVELAADDFERWRTAARQALRDQVSPEAITWIDRDASQTALPLNDPADEGARPSPAKRLDVVRPSARVPRRFVEAARIAACHRSPTRWSLLYRLLWRVIHEGAALLNDAADADVHAVHELVSQVRRDEHRMRAFVRFTEVKDTDGVRFVAFHRPDHFIVRLAAPFFAERFAALRWSILTPDRCAHWDGARLTYSAGVTAPPDTAGGDIEALWRTYYAAVFNPARVNEKAMLRELPRRHWSTLPETAMIPALIASAAERASAFAREPDTASSARAFVPAARDLTSLRQAAPGCRGCDLYRRATAVVFGEGASGGLLIVGEQPGDVEDRTGRPFVGPAGEVLDRALADAGIARDTVYVTNAVKHFSFEERGKRRIHKTPRASEVRACRPWLEAEIQAVRPRCVICLGATAAQSLLGPQARVLKERGRVIGGTAWAPAVVVTVHPSAVLRADDGAEYFAMLVADLRLAANAV